MDWKYKHFHQERVFPASRHDVTEAARTFMAESLGWQVTDTPDGFSAEGYSFRHRAIANLHIESAAGGASASGRGWPWNYWSSALVGGGSCWSTSAVITTLQIHKWLDGVDWSLHQKRSGIQDESANPLVLAQHKPAAYIFNGCLMFIVVSFALYFLVTFISAAVGLLTGDLFLVGRGTLIIHGTLARILSAMILMFGVFLVWRIKSSDKR
jgi:hypothetical protein